MSAAILRQSRGASIGQIARWLPSAVAPLHGSLQSCAEPGVSVPQASMVDTQGPERSLALYSRGFAASASNPPTEPSDAQDKPDIFQLFEAMEKQYEHVPWVPIAYGEDDWREQKEERVTRERKLQEQVAAARVRKVDADGRAHGLGKRKSAVARVTLWEHSPAPELPADLEAAGQRQSPRPRPPQMVNGRPFVEYFHSMMHREVVLEPFSVSGSHNLFGFDVFVKGGGSSGQAQAVRLGIARALQNYNPEFRSVLRPAGLLTRDSRVVERKKPGKAKARKSFQWVKR